jgi:hypothetical protein
MGLLNRLGRLLNPPPPESTFYRFTVRCQRCGELIEGKINVYNDPSAEYGATGKPTYHCRKVLVGAGRCYQKIEVTFEFDEHRHVLARSATGGEFVDA